MSVEGSSKHTTLAGNLAGFSSTGLDICLLDELLFSWFGPGKSLWEEFWFKYLWAIISLSSRLPYILCRYVSFSPGVTASLLMYLSFSAVHTTPLTDLDTVGHLWCARQTERHWGIEVRWDIQALCSQSNWQPSGRAGDKDQHSVEERVLGDVSCQKVTLSPGGPVDTKWV